MSKFVNYNKRGVELPPGYKNLIDVLQSKHPLEAGDIVPLCKPPAFTRNESGTVKLSEIEKYVAMFFHSQAHSCMLTLGLPDERHMVNLSQVQAIGRVAVAMLHDDPERDRLMRAFFVERGLELPADDVKPKQFVPGVPEFSIYKIRPQPSDATTASKLVRDMFRAVCGVKDEDSLTFHFGEVANTA